MDQIVHIFKIIVDYGNTYIWDFPHAFPWLVVLLLGTGIFVTLRFVFIQLRGFGHALNVIRGKYDDPEDEGDISHFQALCTALSATVGIGNIAGVATAIHYGGPGAVFWMWLTAIFGMALKFTECTLSHKYRVFDDQQNAAGGPMYYIEKGLGSRFKWLAIFFAACAVVSSFGMGNMNQANTVALSARSDLGIAPWISGLVIALLVGAVIIGGIKRIGKVTSKLAPFMCLVYLAGGIAILVLNFTKLPNVVYTIVSNAFNPRAGFGGTVAGAFSVTLIWGIKRGLFSNEAGLGSAPIAHAAAKTKEPVREGLVAMMGPFIDTLVVCSITAFVIILTGVWTQTKQDRVDLTKLEFRLPAKQMNGVVAKQGSQPYSGDLQIKQGHWSTPLRLFINDGSVEQTCILTADGQPFSGTLHIDKGQLVKPPQKLTVSGRMLQNSSALTAWAFQQGLRPLGNWGNWIVTFSVFLFALSTIISWSYYGDRAVQYLWGTRLVIYYRLVYVVVTFLGAVLALELVWAYGDLALGLMAVPNLLAIILLSNRIVPATKDYFKRKASSFS